MKEMRKGKERVFKLLVVGLLTLALVVTNVYVAPFGETEVGVKASDVTTVTVSEVTIDGTIGTPIEEQTIELTVANGEFNTEMLYVGKDISDYFVYSDRMKALKPSKYYWRRGGIGELDFKETQYIPLGLKVIISEVTEEKITCTVTGTPLSPSISTINVYFRPGMFKNYTGSGYNCAFSATNAKWNIPIPKKAKGAASFSSEITAADLTGTAGETNFDFEFSITLSEAVFKKDIPSGTDVSSWFSGNYSLTSGQNNYNYLPVGVKAVTAKKISKGDATCTLKLTGVPQYGCTNGFAFSIPLGYVIASPNTSPTSYNDGVLLCSNSGVSFNIASKTDEKPYFQIQTQDMIVYAGYNYKNTDGGRSYSSDSDSGPSIFMRLLNKDFAESPVATSGKAWTDNEDKYVFSNTNGELNTNAPGFLYSPYAAVSDMQFRILGCNLNTWQKRVANTYYLSFGGKFSNVGEYTVSWFVPLSYISGYEEEEGYTTAVADKGRLIVIKPLQLEIDDADIVVKSGEMIEEYFTVKISDYSFANFKNATNLEAKDVAYTVSNDITSRGLTITPVASSAHYITFKLSGTVSGKPVSLNLADCIKLSYSNFELGGQAIYNSFEAFGDIEINENPDALLTIASGSGIYGKAGQEIDYTEREDVIIYANNASGTKVETTYINMTKETFTTDMDYKAYSVDGGNKWKKVDAKLTDAQFAKLLAKGMTFAITDELDEKGKKPSDKATILKFSKTEKADGAPKFKVDYVTWEDPSGATTGQFILTKADGTVYTATELRETYEIGIASGKTVDENGYGIWPTK
ncbi:MAG: hypothetical protein K6E47_07290, partial [Lachnospiraceae bacterium]|nr:hypothetical protein [Lachnospiraceae bacterium]